MIQLNPKEKLKSQIKKAIVYYGLLKSTTGIQEVAQTPIHSPSASETAASLLILSTLRCHRHCEIVY